MGRYDRFLKITHPIFSIFIDFFHLIFDTHPQIHTFFLWNTLQWHFNDIFQPTDVLHLTICFVKYHEMKTGSYVETIIKVFFIQGIKMALEAQNLLKFTKIFDFSVECFQITHLFTPAHPIIPFDFFPTSVAGNKKYRKWQKIDQKKATF